MFGGKLSEADKARAKAGEVVTLANGAQGTYVNGKWRLVKGADAAYMDRIRASRGKKPLSSKSAKRAFNRYYRQRDYESPRARKAAISRDMHFSPRNASKVTDTTRYLRNPGKLDYPGVDAGERRSSATGNLAALERARLAPRSARRSGKNVRKFIKHASPEQRARASAAGKARRAARKAAQAGGRRQQWDDEEPMMAEEEQAQDGGRAVSLKTAVKLLRSYYSNRYGRRQ